MFRWISLFGLRREQPKTRRPKETVKPRVEELTQRILLSASTSNSPQMAEMTVKMTAMMEQTFQLIETVEHNLANIFDTYTQRIAQDVASAVQQWKQLLGLSPPASGSGSGSGSGTIMTTHNNPTQPPIPIRPQSGRGSGSGATTSHENPSKSGHMPMSGSCGSGSGSGPIPVVSFGSGSNPFYEESGSCAPVYATRAVMLSTSTCHDVTVKYYTKDGTAIAGTDYVGVGSGSGIGTVTIPAGQVSAPLPIEIQILDDGNDDPGNTQDFYVFLTRPNGATLGNNKTDVKIAERTQKATDTLRWIPCEGNNASTVTNWVDMSQGAPFRLDKRSLGPNPLSPIQFDDDRLDTPISNANITWDKSYTIASVSLIQYTGQQTLSGGVEVESKGANGTSLGMDASSWLKLDFQPYASKFQIDANATITNMVLSSEVSVADFVIKGGTTTISQSDYTEKLGVNLTIESGATLVDKNQCTLTLTADPVVITVQGEMDTYAGPKQQNTMIAGAAGNKGDLIEVPGGTLKYAGSFGTSDTIGVPIAVDSSGTFIVGGDPRIGSGTLIVTGYSANTKNNSVYLADSGSSVQLSGRATLQAGYGYYQAAGTLETMDSTFSTLEAGLAGFGTATIAGGSVIINESGGYGQLNVATGTLNFNGALVVAINAAGDVACVLNVENGTINLQANSTLTVYANNGPPAGGKKWVVIKAANPINPGNFVMPMAVIPGYNLSDGVDPKNNKQYIVSS